MVNSAKLFFENSPHLKWIVFTIAFLLYLNTINHQMALDDYSVIVTHSHVQNGLEGISEILTTNYRNGNGGFNDGLYRPLSLVTFALEKEFFDSNTTISHLINVLLYAFACMYLFMGLAKVLSKQSKLIVLLIVVIFISHPLHTEVVANIKGRDELLAFFGFTLALNFLYKYLSNNKIANLTATVGFFILALFSKESAVTYSIILPLILLLNNNIKWKQLLKPTLTLVALASGFILLRHHIISSMPNSIDPGNFGLLNNPIAAETNSSLKWGSIFSLQVLFLQKLFFPFQLIHDYSFSQIVLVKLTSVKSILGIVILSGGIAATVYGVLKRNTLGIIAAIYFCTIALSSQIAITIGVQFAERMLFLSVLAFAFAMVFLLKLAFQKMNLTSEKTHNYLTLTVACVCLLFSFKTISRNSAWENNLSLYEADITNGINSARINYNLGTELMEQASTINNAQLKSNTLERSFTFLENAISIYPEYYDAYNNLGLAYKIAQNYSNSIATFKKGISINPNYNKYYFNLGTVYIAHKKYRNAIIVLSEYAARTNNNSSAYFLMGEAAGNIQEFEESLGYFQESLRQNPTNENAYNFIGMAQGMLGRNAEANANFIKATQLAPNREDILMNLALSYNNLGMQLEFRNTLNRVLSVNPNNAQARSMIN